MPRTAKSQISFADWELLQQGISLDPLLQEISEFLEDHEEIIDAVRRDLERGLKKPGTGRRGLTPSQVLRSFVLMRVKNWDYRELLNYVVALVSKDARPARGRFVNPPTKRVVLETHRAATTGQRQRSRAILAIASVIRCPRGIAFRQSVSIAVVRPLIRAKSFLGNDGLPAPLSFIEFQANATLPQKLESKGERQPAIRAAKSTTTDVFFLNAALCCLAGFTSPLR